MMKGAPAGWSGREQGATHARCLLVETWLDEFCLPVGCFGRIPLEAVTLFVKCKYQLHDFFEPLV